MNSYLFYDIETTGLNPAFDQILQFAAIRTDMTLKEIDRYTLNVRLRPDVIPSPRAVLTHGIGAAESGSGDCEFGAITRIHQWVNQPGTISVGYNSLNFDDTFLRFSFYRNLLAPYTHQYDKGCQRMDLYPMTIAFWLYRPEVIKWPKIGKEVSLTLEALNTVNGFAAGRSHDALTDTTATLALARQLMSEQDMWNYLAGYFHKTTDLLRMDRLPEAFHSTAGPHRQALMISGEFGSKNGFQVPVLGLGKSDAYTNQTLWLRLDLAELREVTVETIADATWVIRKKMGEPGLLLPTHERYWKTLAPDRRDIARENIQWLRDRADLFGAIVRYHRDYRYPVVPDVDVDAALYDIGFLSREEENLCRKFHAASFQERVDVAESFPSAELRELAARVLIRNDMGPLPKGLSKKRKHLMDRANPPTEQAAMVDYKGAPRTTPRAALLEIQTLKRAGDLSFAQIELLDALAVSIRDRFGIETDNP